MRVNCGGKAGVRGPSAAGRYDVVVVGAGVSGVAAAVGAALRGVKVLLVDREYCPGGTAVYSLVSPMQTFHSPAGRVIGGVAQELVTELSRRGGSPGHVPDPIGFVQTVTPVDPEALKAVMLDVLERSGVDFSGGTRFEGVRFAREGVLGAVVLKGEGGEEWEVGADAFVDATGNGDLTHASGVSMETDPDCQPMTLIFRVGGVDAGAIIAFQKAHPEEFVLNPDPSVLDRGYVGVSGFFTKVAKARESGRLTVPRDRLLFFGGVRADEVVVNTTRVQGFSGLRTEDLSAAMREGMRQARELFGFMKEEIPGFANAFILQAAPRIGVRETRRLIGRYRLVEDDLTGAKTFPDVVAKGAYPMDIHSAATDGIETLALGGGGHYDVPLRCLLNGAVNNLVTVGKCISVTHRGFSSTRVMPTCMAAGQAGGVAASFLAGAPETDLEERASAVQDALIAQGAILFDNQVGKY
ncbi:MAG: FAD-dependent oxidoreductase [bacterium]